jgi:short-subunit dehydrogenase
MRKVLVTGAGTGLGRAVAMRRAEKDLDVVAEADRGVELRVEKLDVTSDGDRHKALGWGIEILVNNAGTGEGGSTVDVPVVCGSKQP